MRVGLNLPQYEIDFASGDASAPAVIDLARRAEALGLDAVWLSDHPFVIGPDGLPSGALDPLVLLGALARRTARVRVGTLVLAATMRSPALVAHAARTLASVAPGRATLGIGTGWYGPEHHAYGIPLPPFPERTRLVEASLVALRALGNGRPALLVGGSSPSLLDVAARRADAWNLAWDPPVDAFGGVSERLDVACERAGRDPRTIARSVGVTVCVAPDRRGLSGAVERLRARAAYLSGVGLAALERSIIAGTPAQCAERMAAYGADEVVVTLLIRDDREMLELFAEEVVPLLSR
jgi:alkanesulfonate monooxygenase SsuD/methylene tetrahydromethanopterin reductase-like flavin-dependent oxidoreductase (luciferase family)